MLNQPDRYSGAQAKGFILQDTQWSLRREIINVWISQIMYKVENLGQ